MCLSHAVHEASADSAAGNSLGAICLAPLAKGAYFCKLSYSLQSCQAKASGCARQPQQPAKRAPLP